MLTDTAIRKAKPGAKPVKLADGGGLYLLLRPDGARWWRWDYRRPVTGKRNKTRIVPLLPQVRTAIEAYVEACPWPPEKGNPLFRGARGGPLSPALIRRAVQGARGRLGRRGGWRPRR